MKESIGQASLRVFNEVHERVVARDQTTENLTDYTKNLEECLTESIKKYIHSFYIVCLTKRERLINNVIRNYFFSRTFCPTPNYDQAVYRYDNKKKKLEFIWVIPDRETCFLLKRNALEASFNEKELLSYVLDYADGTLYKKCKKLNGETLKPGIVLEKAKM